MTRSIKRRARRNKSGVSLTELLVGSLLLGSSLAVVAELMSLCVLANTKLFRQFDAQRGVSVALDRIKRDVRMAQEIRSALNPEEQLELGQQKSLSSSVLILRLPIPFLAKANAPDDPAYDASAPPDDLNGYTIPGYHLVVYEVSPDIDAPGEFKLTMSRRLIPNLDSYKSKFPWFAERSFIGGKVDAQTIAKGIIGPVDAGDTAGGFPKTFSYVAKNPSRVDRLDTLKEGVLYSQPIAGSVSLISVDLEVKRGESVSQSSVSANEKILGVHTEAQLRNLKTSIGPYEQALFEQQ